MLSVNSKDAGDKHKLKVLSLEMTSKLGKVDVLDMIEDNTAESVKLAFSSAPGS